MNTLQKTLTGIAITFDTDWAPDWCVRQCFEMCRSAGVRATFFATNPLPVLKEIAANPNFELGIHPNFLANTTQLPPDLTGAARAKLRGNDMAWVAAVLDYCLKFAPNAKSLRTHGLWQSSGLYAYIEENLPSLCNDISTFLPFNPCPQPIQVQLSPRGRALTRFVFNWEDDIAIIKENAQMLSSCQISPNLLYIYNFHPVHILLNSSSPQQYEEMKKTYKMNEISPDNLLEFTNSTTFGVRDYFKHIIAQNNTFHTIKKLGEQLAK